MVTVQSTSEPTSGSDLWQQKKNCWKRCLYAVCAKAIARVINATGIVSIRSCKTVITQQGHEHGSRGVFIVGSCYHTMPMEEKNRLRLSVCYSDLLSVWISSSVVFNCSYKSPENPIGNPNLMSRYQIVEVYTFLQNTMIHLSFCKSVLSALHSLPC